MSREQGEATLITKWGQLYGRYQPADMIVCPSPATFESTIPYYETPDTGYISTITLAHAVAKFNGRGTIRSLQKAASEASKAKKEKEKAAKTAKKGGRSQNGRKRKAAEVDIGDQTATEMPAPKKMTLRGAKK